MVNTIKDKTRKKYSAFIDDCAHQKTFVVSSIIKNHKVDASIITTLRHEGYVASVTTDVCNWIVSMPTSDMVDRIIASHKERVKRYAEQRKKRNKLREEMDKASVVAAAEEANAQFIPEPSTMSERDAIEFLKSRGYEIYKVERKQL